MRKSQLAKTLLIVRLSSLGDVVIASPFAEVLKKHNPNARIVWAAQPEAAELLRSNPYIDEVFIWNKALWLDLWKQKRLMRLWGEIKKTREALHAMNIETAFDLQGLFKSGFITWLSGAKSRIGIGSREGSYWFMHKMVSRNIANREQLGSEYRYLANQLGYSDGDWPVRVYTTPESRENANTIIRSVLKEGEAYAVICPFSTRPQKHWPDDYWQQLVLRIRGRYQLKTVILGARHEGTLGQQLSRRCGAINLAGQTGLQEAAEIIAGASVTIGVDNALTHIAQSSPNPAIALFGPSCPYIYNGVESSKVLYLDMFCSPCRRKPICGGTYDCMRDIEPDRVLTELKSLIRHAERPLVFHKTG